MQEVDPDAVLGELLREARVRAGLTTEAAAIAARVSPRRIAGIEEGDGLLLVGDLLLLVRAYGLDLRRFITVFERAFRDQRG